MKVFLAQEHLTFFSRPHGRRCVHCDYDVQPELVHATRAWSLCCVVRRICGRFRRPRRSVEHRRKLSRLNEPYIHIQFGSLRTRLVTGVSAGGCLRMVAVDVGTMLTLSCGQNVMTNSTTDGLQL